MAKAKGFQPSPVGLSVSRDVAHKALTMGVLHILRRPQFPQALRYMRGAMAPTYWYKCTKERRHCQVVWAWGVRCTFLRRQLAECEAIVRCEPKVIDYMLPGKVCGDVVQSEGEKWKIEERMKR